MQGTNQTLQKNKLFRFRILEKINYIISKVLETLGLKKI